MRTAIIIVSFGRCELLKQTLSSLFASYPKNEASITVIDNGSQSHVISELIKNKNFIDSLVLLNENRGKPYAWNLGVKIVNERCLALNKERPQFYLFCDSDIVFKEGWLARLKHTYSAHPALGVLSGYNHIKHNPTLINGVLDNSTICLCPFPAGCCMFMHHSIYEKIGAFDDSKLIRTIDTAYYRRVKDAGYITASIFPSVIEHTGWKERTWNISTGKPKLLK